MVFNQHPPSGFALHRDQMMMTGIWVINGRTLMRMQSCIGLSPRIASLTFLPPRHKIGSKLKKIDASFFSNFSGWDDSHSWCFLVICLNLLSFACLISLSFSHLLSFACLIPLSFAYFIGLSCSLFYIVLFVIVIYVPWSYQYNIDTRHLVHSSSIIAITRLPVAVSLLIMACWSWRQAFWRNTTVPLREHNSPGVFLWRSQTENR